LTEGVLLESDNTSAGVFILLPVLNEIENIAALLDEIEFELGGRPYTVGIVDDGSTDGTIAYLQERSSRPGHHLHVIYRKKTHRGSQRGGALRTLLLWGLAHTSHQIFVEMDGDRSHRPQELGDGIRLLELGRCDIAIASKYVAGSRVLNRPFGRRLVSRICSISVGRLISSRIRDYSNGYRFYTREAAQLAADHPYRYGSPIYLTEVLALWLRGGLRVAEFPSTYVGRNEGLSKLRVMDLAKAAIAVLEIASRFHVTGFEFAPRTGRAEQSSCGRDPN
jgi:dolichol-phosphate mannosyltransferase